MAALFELFEIIIADNGLCATFCLGQGGQQHRRQNCDDGNDDKQFNKGETM